MTTASMPGTRRPGDATEAGHAATLQLLDMIGASWMSQVICVACELEIPDCLASGPQNIVALADATRCAPESLQRLLRGLVSLDLCSEPSPDAYALTPMGALLLGDATQGVRSWAIWWGRYLAPLWQDLLTSVRTGRSARERATGRSGYAHLEADSAAAAVFNRAMVELTKLVATEFARACDPARTRRVVDIGGGYGMLLLAVLDACPAARGVLFDLPHAIDSTRSRLAGTAVGARCQFIAGDFFKFVPEGADLYLLKSILHNWSDAQAVQILERCRHAMAPDARLAIIERILPVPIRDAAIDRAVVRSDLNMLVGLGGRERSVAGYSALAATAGLRLTRVQMLVREYAMIECARA